MEIEFKEYSFIMHTCRLGDRAQKGTSPFTGARVDFPIDQGLTAAELSAVHRIFAANGVQGPESAGEGYALYMSGHRSIRFRGLDVRGVEQIPITKIGVEIVTNEISDYILTFLLELARHGNLAFLSSTGDLVGLVEPSGDEKIAKRWPHAAILATTDALLFWLEHDIRGRKVEMRAVR